MPGYNTNLASEFYILSVLHRFGSHALVTLGNKKSVDIVIENNGAVSYSIDVKGLAGRTNWPIGNVRNVTPGHFLALVCYNNRIADPAYLPEVWIVPSEDMERFVYTAPTSRMRVIPRATMEAIGMKYRDAWHLLVPELATAAIEAAR